MKLEKEVAYYCRDRKSAEEFLRLAEKQGFVVDNNKKPTTYLLRSYVMDYEDLCFRISDEYGIVNQVNFCEKKYYENKGYKIVEFKGETKEIMKTTNDIKVIFNDPATILFVDGKKYVSKAHNEDFDEEKGLLMCLAKAQGISHLELKRMIKGAERPSKPSKVVASEKTIEFGPNAICVPVSTHDEMHGNIELKKYIDSKIDNALKKRGRPKKTFDKAFC